MGSLHLIEEVKSCFILLSFQFRNMDIEQNKRVISKTDEKINVSEKEYVNEKNTDNKQEEKENLQNSSCTMKEKTSLLDLSMTAQEMREMILRRKKKDPRKEKRKDMKRRVEMVESL